MNSRIRNLDIESILFFDIEVVRAQKEIDKDSKEFELFKKKIRDRETDTLPEDDVAIEKYNKQAGLRMCYNKIVCISCGAIKKGKLYIKTYTGSEAEIITDFINKTGEYPMVCGFNVKGYDLPMIQVNSFKYQDVPYFPERFNVSDKKPWNLDKVLDLMEVVKGTHFVNISLDEACYHFGVGSSKEGGIDGSMVSDVYYDGGIKDIKEYCERDILATVNLFRKMRKEDIFEDFKIIEEDNIEKTPIIQAISLTKEITKAQEKVLLGKATDLSEEERESFVEIIKAALAKKKFTKKDEDFFDKIRKV